MRRRARMPTLPAMDRQRRLAALTIFLGIALSVLDATAISLFLPTMTRDLGVGPDQAVWIVNGFQLAALVALLPLANWGERITYRRVYLAGAALWGLASAAACVVESLPWLIAARVVQGLGAAGLMAVNMALVRLTWPPALLGRGVALNSMVVGTATVAGPLLAAAVLSLGSWRWLFAMNLLACLLLLALGRRTLPSNPVQTSSVPPSVADIALNAAMFVLLFLAAERFGQSLTAAQGLLPATALLLAALLVGAVHVRRQWGRPRALLPLDLLAIALFRLSMLTSVGSFAAQTMAFIALPFLLLEVWRVAPSQAGLLMSCWPLGTLAAAALAGRWIGRYHNGWLGAVGLGLQMLGLASLAAAALMAWGPGVAVAVSLGLCGVGFGLFQSPNNHTIITSAPPDRSGAASAMLGSARLVGQTLGATLAAVVFALHGGISAPGLAMALLLAATLSAAAATSSLRRIRHRLPDAGAGVAPD